MYRPKSTAVWHSLPGVVAAYQPQYAPGFDASLFNVRNGGDGTYKAGIGVKPTHLPVSGWTFNGTDQYLTTTIAPQDGWSALVTVNNVTANSIAFGVYTGVAYREFAIYPRFSTSRYAYNGGEYTAAGVVTSGVIGFSGRATWVNGVQVSASMTNTISLGSNAKCVFVGAENNNNTGISLPLKGQLLANLYVARPLTHAEMVLSSQQMAHLENPDWSAWGRRRRYYYAPSVAAGVRWPGVGRGGPVGGSIGIRGKQQ